MADEAGVLRHIAQLCAKMRGHELGEWSAGEGCATARCTRCGRELRIYPSLAQPDMEGPALEAECVQSAGQRVA